MIFGPIIIRWFQIVLEGMGTQQNLAYGEIRELNFENFLICIHNFFLAHLARG